MIVEPDTKRVVAFIDGQNLFRSVKECWGYHHPNYDVTKLVHAVGETRAGEGWNAPTVRFYTGTPEPKHDAPWAAFWQRKVAAMRSQGAYVFTRSLRYREQRFSCAKCKAEQRVSCASCGAGAPAKGQEKGVDVRIALDVMRLANENAYDVALIFSQDQDLSEVVDEVVAISQRSGRWVKVACAFPLDSGRRGINNADWIKFDRGLYDKCIDPRDYRR